MHLLEAPPASDDPRPGAKETVPRASTTRLALDCGRRAEPVRDTSRVAIAEPPREANDECHLIQLHPIRVGRPRRRWYPVRCHQLEEFLTLQQGELINLRLVSSHSERSRAMMAESPAPGTLHVTVSRSREDENATNRSRSAPSAEHPLAKGADTLMQKLLSGAMQHTSDTGNGNSGPRIGRDFQSCGCWADGPGGQTGWTDGHTCCWTDGHRLGGRTGWADGQTVSMGVRAGRTSGRAGRTGRRGGRGVDGRRKEGCQKLAPSAAASATRQKLGTTSRPARGWGQTWLATRQRLGTNLASDSA